MTIGETTTTVRTQIITGIPLACILGVNFIRSANLILRAAENCVQVGQERVPITTNCGSYNGPRTVSTTRLMAIEPDQGVTLTVQPDLLGTGKQIIEFTPLAETEAFSPHLNISATLAETNEHGQLQITIQNPTEQTIHIPEGTVVGATTHFEGEVATVTFDDAHSEKEEKAKEEKWKTTKSLWQGRWESREFFLRLFHLSHLEPPLRDELEQLLCRYESIFSSHDFT